MATIYKRVAHRFVCQKCSRVKSLQFNEGTTPPSSRIAECIHCGQSRFVHTPGDHEKKKHEKLHRIG